MFCIRSFVREITFRTIESITKWTAFQKKNMSSTYDKENFYFNYSGRRKIKKKKR